MQIGKQVDVALVRKIFMKYHIMRVRMKISFEAFIKDETVLELWLSKIEQSAKFLFGSG